MMATLNDVSQSQKLRLFAFLSLVFFAASLATTSVPLFVLPFRDDFGISLALAGLLYTSILFGSGIGRFLSGFLVVRFGTSRLILAAVTLMVSGASGVTLASGYLAVLAAAVVLGLGHGIYSPIGFSTVSKLFPENRGVMVGLFDSIFPVSAIGAYLIQRINSFFGTWRAGPAIIGAFLLLAIVGFSLWVPEWLELLSESKKSRLSWRGRAKEILQGLKSNPVFGKIAGLLVPVGLVTFAAMNYFPPLLIEGRGFTEATAGVLYMIFMGLSVPGKVTVGRTLDWYGARRSLILALTLATLGLVFLAFRPSLWGLIVALLLFGPFRGGIWTIMHAHLLGKLHGEYSDILYGFFMVIISVVGATAPPLMGLVIERVDYTVAFTVLICLLASGIPFVWLKIENQ